MSLPSRMFQYQQDWVESSLTQPFTPSFVKISKGDDEFKIDDSPTKKTYKCKQDRDEVLNSIYFADTYLNKSSIHEHQNINSDRVYYMETDYSFKLIVPYSHYMKKKKLFYTPFTWKYEEKLANQITQNSWYIIKEVPLPEMGFYQIQLDRDRIDKIREQIDITFECYYKIMLCNKIRVDCSVEIGKLKRLLRAISSQIESERKFDNYYSDGEEILLSSAIHKDVYEQYKHILVPIIKHKCIPMLSMLHKELYQMGYLDAQYLKLKESLDFVAQDLNQTISVLVNLKKKVESITNLSSLTEKDFKKLEKIKKPHQIYSYFFDLALKSRLLYSEAKAPSKLKYLIQKYLKAIIVLEVYKEDELRLKEWKKKLLSSYKQLQKKLDSSKSNIKDMLEKKQTGLSESDLSIEHSKIDIKKIIEEESIDNLVISDIKDQLSNIEIYIKKIQKFCENINSERDGKKIFKFHSETSNYLEQVDQLIQGIAFAKDIYEKIKEKISKDSFEDKSPEDIEKEVVQEYKGIASQIKISHYSFNFESWDPTKLTSALNHVIERFLKIKKKDKAEEKTIPFKREKIMTKLAKIIRERKKQKNKFCMSAKARVGSCLNVYDIIELLKSKKLWQAIISAESHLVSIKGCVQDENKTVNHKIYCNSELEIYIVKIIKSFVNSLSESAFKSSSDKSSA